jgi:heme oxygenase
LSTDKAFAELRLTTRAEHDRIEQILRLTDPMPLERYAAIVCGFDAFLRVWEPRVLAALPERLQGWYRTRRRGGFASADLEWLRSVAGIEPPALHARAAELLPLRDLPEALGSLYVIEGSALGGRVIAPHLKRSLGLDQGRGASYFHGFGGETGVMWAGFRTLAALELGESAGATVAACRSARRTFGALIELFAPLAAAEAAPPVRSPEGPGTIDPRLLAAWADDEDPEDDDATRPMPLPPVHVELPMDLHGVESDTVFELPLDEPPLPGAAHVR